MKFFEILFANFYPVYPVNPVQDSSSYSQADPFHFLSTTIPEDHVPTAKQLFWLF